MIQNLQFQLVRGDNGVFVLDIKNANGTAKDLTGWTPTLWLGAFTKVGSVSGGLITFSLTVAETASIVSPCPVEVILVNGTTTLTVLAGCFCMPVDKTSSSTFPQAESTAEIKDKDSLIWRVTAKPLHGFSIIGDPSLPVLTVKGETGATGPGVPGGGTTGQVLAKNTNANLDAGWITLTKASVGLAFVDNTPDLSKPISTATQTALDAKMNASFITQGTCALTFGGTDSDGNVSYLGAVSTWTRINKRCRILGYIFVSAITTAPTGSLVLRGIPFPVITSSGVGPGGTGIVGRSSIPSLRTLFNFAGDGNIFVGEPGGGFPANLLSTGFYYFTFEYETP